MPQPKHRSRPRRKSLPARRPSETVAFLGGSPAIYALLHTDAHLSVAVSIVGAVLGGLVPGAVSWVQDRMDGRNRR